MAFNISYIYEVIDRASAVLRKIARASREAAKAAGKVSEKARKGSTALTALGEKASTASTSLTKGSTALTALGRKALTAATAARGFGFDLAGLGGAQRDAARASGRFSAALTRLSAKFSRMREKALSSASAMDVLKSKWGEFVALAASTIAIAFPIRQAIDFEAAMANVRKVVDFPDPDGLEKMAAAIKRMSTEFPVTQAGLAAIVTAGGQLGVPVGQLEEFAKLASKMAIAFDILPDEAGEAIAKLSVIFGKPIDQMERVADAINFVSNNTAASAAQIVRSLKSAAGASGRDLGLMESQTIALVTAFISQGLTAEKAGTAIRILARNLKNTAKTTRILGEEFTELVKTDPQEAIFELLRVIKSGKVPNEDLQKLLGETVSNFSLLAKTVDNYKNILGFATDETRLAGSVQKEFEVRSATTRGQLKLLGNSARNIAINFGTILLPAVNNVASALAFASDKIAFFFEEFPFFTKLIGSIVAGLILAKAATLAWTVAQLALNVVMRANPIGLIITAITTVISLAILFKDELSAILEKMAVIGKMVFKFTPLGAALRAAGAISEFIAPQSELREMRAVTSGQEVSGNIGVEITFAGDAGRIQRVETRGIRQGKLGFNAVVL